jgi:hypothetical protein
MGMLDYAVHRRPETLIRVKQEILRGEGPRWIRNSKRARYIAQVVLSTPPWVDRDALKRIQERARQLTELSGVDHHIAHVVPLNHPRVCGLTVPWNLEIKPAKINLAESNNIHLDEQLDLFA